jgi:peptidoglycan/LPS O-acetylase OafA/YrhL
MSTNVFKLGQRPELDGVRGIAVLLVVAHHFAPARLPGGFLGVDIFFVLSGFLITTLLLEEQAKHGCINLRFFYLRRILRLLPAVLAMLCAVCLFLWLAGDAKALANARNGAFYTLAYVANWVRAWWPLHSLEPFDITWSLAIEEQFYLVWPLLLLVFLKSKARPSWLIGGLLFGLVAVIAHRWILWQETLSPARIYYGTDTRADALLCGCLVAAVLHYGYLPATERAREYFNGTAYIFLLWLIYLTWTTHSDEGLLFMGGYTLVALGVAVWLLVLMLWPARLVLHTLRWPPLRWCGRVSYGLYLWHWPVLVLGVRKYGFEWPAALALTFGITALSYYLLEQPALRLKKRFQVNH